MTKKDFEAIAGAIKDARMALPDWPQGSNGAKQQRQVLDSMAATVAASLATTNPRFDREKFLTACGVQRP